MSTPSARRSRRQRGGIEELPSGGLQVYVYAGTGRRHYLRESIPAGPTAQPEAEKVMRRLATEVDERRNPRTSATVNQLLDRHFELADLEGNTLTNYRNLASKHLRHSGLIVANTRLPLRAAARKGCWRSGVARCPRGVGASP